MPSKPSTRKKLAQALALAALAASFLPISRAADNPLGAPAPFAGKFSDDAVTVELAESAGAYSGTISQNGNKFPATATVSAQTLNGKFTAAGTDFTFTATLENDHLILVTAGTTYKLVRDGAKPLAKNPVNPLAAGGISATAQTPAAPAGGTAAGDFTELGTTAHGVTLFIKLPAANSVESAINQTADELAKIADARPTLTGAFADTKTKGRGGALFTGKFKAKDMRGWIFCANAADGKGMSATVVVARADTPKEELDTLLAYLPAKVKMETHQFPDGSGSVDLPPGWTTQQQSLTHGCAVIGPAGQMVVLGNTFVINTPTGNMVQLRVQAYNTAMQTYEMQMNSYRQNVQFRRQHPNILALPEPIKPTEPDPERDMPQLIFCPYCAGPEEVLKNFYPVMERRSKNAGALYSHVEKVLAVVPAESNPLIPNDKAGVCYLLDTDHDGQKTTAVRVLNRIETYPVQEGKDVWVTIFNVMRAPDATFDRDLPVMNDIMNSFKINNDVVNKQITQEGENIRKIGDENERQLLKKGRDFNKQQDDQFHHMQEQEIARENARHDAASDFIEMINGVREVRDNKTGEMHTVDLGNANNILNGLNENAGDPNRFEQIPLRTIR